MISCKRVGRRIVQSRTIAAGWDWLTLTQVKLSPKLRIGHSHRGHTGGLLSFVRTNSLQIYRCTAIYVSRRRFVVKLAISCRCMPRYTIRSCAHWIRRYQANCSPIITPAPPLNLRNLKSSEPPACQLPSHWILQLRASSPQRGCFEGGCRERCVLGTSGSIVAVFDHVPTVTP